MRTKFACLAFIALVTFTTASTFLEEPLVISESPSDEELLTQKYIKDLSDFSKEDLIKMALVYEDYRLAKLPKEIMTLRGLRDFIYKVDEDFCRKIVADQLAYYKQFTLTELMQKAGVHESNKFSSFFEYLSKLSQDENTEYLRKLALAADNYKKFKTGTQKLIGGLHDYVYRLNNSQIIRIIKKYIDEYPELAEHGLIHNLVGKTLRTAEEVKAELKDVDQSTLAKLVILCEDYERNKTGVQLIGGFHDFAFTLPKEKLINIIGTFTLNNPELSPQGSMMGFLQNEANRYRNGSSEIMPWNLYRSELMRLAEAVEDWANNKLGREVLGGLHDYIWNLSKEEITKILRDYMKNFPELANPGVFGSLVKDPPIPEGGFQNVIEAQDLPVLRKWALAVERYDVDNSDGSRRLSLKDYISSLSKEKLIQYIVGVSDRWTKLLDEKTLNNLVEKYNIE